jgi:hypothetical protein
VKAAEERLEALGRILSAGRYRYHDELELHELLGETLTMAGVAFEREVVIAGGGRVDILALGIAIEVKVDGSASQVLRQLQRYARCDDVDGILLVTSRARHWVPEELAGKPVAAVSLLAQGAFG